MSTEPEPITVHVWAEGQRIHTDNGVGYRLYVAQEAGDFLHGHTVVQAEDGTWATYDGEGNLTATANKRGTACMKHARVLTARRSQ